MCNLECHLYMLDITLVWFAKILFLVFSLSFTVQMIFISVKSNFSVFLFIGCVLKFLMSLDSLNVEVFFCIKKQFVVWHCACMYMFCFSVLLCVNLHQCFYLFMFDYSSTFFWKYNPSVWSNFWVPFNLLFHWFMYLSLWLYHTDLISVAVK